MLAERIEQTHDPKADESHKTLQEQDSDEDLVTEYYIVDGLSEEALDAIQKDRVYCVAVRCRLASLVHCKMHRCGCRRGSMKEAHRLQLAQRRIEERFCNNSAHVPLLRKRSLPQLQLPRQPPSLTDISMQTASTLCSA